MPTSLGPAEILVILVVALIVLGPKRLPEAGRQVGKAIAEVRRWTTEVTSEIKSAVDIEVPPKSTVVAAVVVPDTTSAVVTRDEPASTSAVVAMATVADAGPSLVADHEALAAAKATADLPEPAAIEPESAAIEPAAATESAAIEPAESHASPEASAGSTDSPPGDPARL